MNRIERIVLEELVERPQTTNEIARISGASEAEIIFQLRDLNDRIKRLLRYDFDPITVTSTGAWKADGIAGLLRLNSRIELEIVPKFLNPEGTAWRSDFFLLAVLVNTGRLLVHDEISADVRDRGDLATLVARSLLTLHEENHRRPIRSYRRMQRADFSFDGDVEWESLVMPEPDGFRLSRLELTRNNPYNATLAAAVDILIPEVGDGDTQNQLRQLARHLAPQAPPPSVFPLLPQRHSAWEETYNLARLVVQGLGLDLKGGTFSGPGFVLSTWSAWQSLCEEVMRRALPNWKVTPQKRWVLGYRGMKPFCVTPDLSIEGSGGAGFLLDAKYKTRAGRKPSIASVDVYESLAFLGAADASYICLLYPATIDVGTLPVGGWSLFEAVIVRDLTIEGYELQVQGLADRGGFGRLVAGARTAIKEISARRSLIS